jgi:3-hydroxyisobutyrate dehydrogenase
VANEIRVGFVGLGHIGAPMAKRIIAAGFPTTLWARRETSFDQFGAANFRRADELVAVGRNSDVVGICVTGQEDVEGVLFGEHGILAGMSDGVVLIHSTISTSMCATFARNALDRGVHLLDAPISGSPEGAINGTLAVMVGGEYSAFEYAEPVMRAFGSVVRHFGAIGSGQRMKLLNNMLVFANLRTSYEAVVVGEALGLDRDAVLETLQVSSGRSHALTALATRLVDPDRAIHSAHLLEKDWGLFRDLTESEGVSATLFNRLAGEAHAIVREIGEQTTKSYVIDGSATP